MTTSGHNYRPRWSPDGTRIAYVRATASVGSDIWTMRGDGSQKHQVTRFGHVSGPTWSPDGSQIAFGGDNVVGGPAPLRVISATSSSGYAATVLGEDPGADSQYA